MKPLRTALLLLIAFFLQPAAVKLISWGGAGPNLLLCFTVFLVLTAREPAPVIGLCTAAAAVQEMCFSLYTGPGTAAIFTVGITAVLAGNFFTVESPAFLAGLIAAETLLHSGVLWVVRHILGAPYRFLHVLSLQPFYILYNLAIMALLYFIFFKKAEGRYSL
ncbi:hypothetical protein NE619_15215 [Anaerovorax odorimutans]|uniref:Rod shape-determining protein MreD n=1 Tax=Anaerovorax odorimutans TaxID=109327 RepID=A0ABT1RSF7_9FIRM|nr:hypothetical protein [Anaerovorax odorimutans]MCQ4638086.1 hypothetical protein [Anaerovorax odorimutans]